MPLAERTLAFAAQAPDVHTQKQLCARLMSVLDEVGASRFGCLYLRRHNGEVIIDRSISNLPRAWLELYLARGYEATDPVFQTVVRGASFGYWNELTRGLVLDRPSREVMTAARDFEMNDGFTKRVILDGGGVAVVMAAGQELKRNPRVRAALRMALDVFANEGVRMIKTRPNGSIDPASTDTSKPALSKTQLRVLLMRAEGMSNKQVAVTMKRHEKTVECHVTEVLRRLEARNMIDAIRIATKHKLIV
jgi:DNA-binding CsgD family transcriptional regulator